MIEPVREIIEDLNKVLTKILLEQTSDKRVLMDFSGGHDTRVNLAILLRNKVDFTAYTLDISEGDLHITDQIANSSLFNFKHIIDINNTPHEILQKEFDIKLTAIGYTESMNALHRMHCSIRSNIDLYHKVTSFPQTFMYTAACEKEYEEVIAQIPICYLMGSIVQKELIRMNTPELLWYPFTYYDRRHYLMNTFYPYFVDFLFNSYYRGKGRNFYDVKAEKDQWWNK